MLRTSFGRRLGGIRPGPSLILVEHKIDLKFMYNEGISKRPRKPAGQGAVLLKTRKKRKQHLRLLVLNLLVHIPDSSLSLSHHLSLHNSLIKIRLRAQAQQNRVSRLNVA